MPIRLLLQHDQDGDHSFQPEDISKIVSAFEGALRALKLTNRDDPATLMVAKTIFEAAKRGERDPVRLRDIAVNRFSK